MKIKDNWKKKALVNKEQYDELYKDSIDNNDSFWNKQGKRLNWIKDYTKIKDVTYSNKDVSIK